MQQTLKETTTVCGDCLEKVPGTVVERDAQVILKRACPTHGESEALLASDSALYWNQGDVKGCGVSCCGAADNHSLFAHLRDHRALQSHVSNMLHGEGPVNHNGMPLR